MTAIATTGARTSALGPGVHRLTETAVVVEEEGSIEADAMLKVLAGLIWASRLHLSSTVPRLLSTHGVILLPGGLPWLKPKTFPKTLLNLIKVLRMSAWLRIPRICI